MGNLNAFEGEQAIAWQAQVHEQNDRDSDHLVSIRPKRKAWAPKANMYLSVGEIHERGLFRLVEPETGYAAWIRVVLMRIVLAAGPLKSGTSRADLLVAHAEEVWGIRNLERYLDLHGPTDTNEALKHLLSLWESELPCAAALPPRLEANLKGLEQLLQLNETEHLIVGFVMLLHSEELVDDFCGQLGSSISANRVPRLLSNILKLDLEQVQTALSEEGKLAQTELVTLDYYGEGSLRTRIDPICRTFAQRVFMQHSGPLAIVGNMVRQSPLTRLVPQELRHVQDRLDICSAYLRNAQATGMRGANILLYGEPGTGKTEFARYLVHRLDFESLEVGVGNERGNSVPPFVRLKYYKLAQGLLTTQRAMVLFDECEEVLSKEMVKAYANGDQNLAHKSWINCLLETNPTPTIWIANSVEDFDAALIRRFDLVMEMPLPPQSARREMLQSLCSGVLSPHLLGRITANNGSTPAMLAQTARVLNAVSEGQESGKLEGIANTLVNDRFAAQGQRTMGSRAGSRLSMEFEPTYVNTTMPLTELRDGLRLAGQGRICLYGPSGTGKTAFGKWLSQSLDLPCHFYKASDLLAPHVGNTERNIAKAFMKASAEGAVLQIDEVDSFLQDRATARQGWEVSLVNEMLTQLEGFDGVFVGSTNRFEQMDAAVMRRFDLSLKFDYLAADAAWCMFQRACDLLGLTTVDGDRPPIVALQKLTPGDFDQVLRQSAYRRPGVASDVSARLREATAQKPGGSGSAMGFLH